MNPRIPSVAAFIVALLIGSSSVRAHRLSTACLTLVARDARIEGRFDVPIRDWVQLVPLDRNGDNSITWGELRTEEPTIHAQVSADLRLELDGVPLRLGFFPLKISEIAGEPCASITFEAPLRRKGRILALSYEFLRSIDNQHRGLLKYDRCGPTETLVLGPSNARVEFFFDPDASSGAAFIQFVREGIHHIWIGLDHVLFLIALLLPAVLFQTSRDTAEPPGFAPVALRVLKVVTAFTIAHSITLGLAAFDLVRLPARFVESAIAASVAVAAVNNLFRFFQDRGWAVAFGFGLVHGFGFAGVLADLRVPSSNLAEGLLGFNLGVEAGQLAIVSLFLPIAYLLRQTWAYRMLTVRGGSLCILFLAAAWLVERATNTRLLPF